MGQGDACLADPSRSSGSDDSPEPWSALLILGRPGSIWVAPVVSCRVSLPPSPARGAAGSCSSLSPVQPLAGTPRTARRVSSVLQRRVARSACEEHRAAAEQCPLPCCQGPRAGHVPSLRLPSLAVPAGRAWRWGGHLPVGEPLVSRPDFNSFVGGKFWEA